MAQKRRAPRPKTESKIEASRRKDAELIKGESMRIRVSTADKSVLEQAAARLAQSVSAFVLAAAMEKARRDLGT
jgi:uncharacterized protein (DUF1778 family)